MNNSEKITGAEYAERLLAVNSPTRLIDHLIEKLAAKTGTGWESNLLEFKGSYHKRPDSDDPDSQDCFEWNVMHAFIALANAQGGCVVLGIAETDDHRLVPGDWDPDGILGCRDADGDGKPIPGREEKDLIDHVYGIFFKEKFKRNGHTYKFTTQNKRNVSAPPVAHEFTLDAETLSKLSKLVTFYPCHSERCSCNALAAIVHPVKKDDDLIVVRRTKKDLAEDVVFYRDITAKTCELTKHNDIRHYEDRREPASSDYLNELQTTPARTPRTATPYTTVPSCDPHFIGRGNELRRLHEICSQNKIALIHAPGGTGKTQLALKYTTEYATEYPGGCFYAPAETAKDWSGVLRNLIGWKTSSTGVPPEEWIGLVTSDTRSERSRKESDPKTSKDNAKPSYTDADIANALIKKARVAGPILLVIDNVENPGDLLATRAIKRTFPFGLPHDIHVLATARSRKGVNPSACSETTTFSLVDISTEDALILINCAEAFESEDEKDAARKIINILDHRALYVARMASLKNDFAEHSFSRLLKKLKRDKLEVVKPTYDGDDPRTPAVLWQWARETIAKSDKGCKCIKLLQTLALFPADGMSTNLLEYFWYSDFGKLDPPATLAAYKEDPDLFKDDLLLIDAYSLIQKDLTSNTLRMHRLDRAAIRTDLNGSESTLRDEVGEALHTCPIYPAKGWVELAQADSDLMDFCAWEVLGGEEISNILIVHPEYKSSIRSWNILAFKDWLELILVHPEFARHPAFKHTFNFPAILGLFPELADCFNLQDLNGHVWATMLSAGAPLTDVCPWERLNKEDWLLLLSTHPALWDHNPHPEILYAKTQVPNDIIEFFARIDTNRLRQYIKVIDHLRNESLLFNIFDDLVGDEDVHKDKDILDKLRFSSGPNWGMLLNCQPSLAEKCHWSKLNQSDWESILHNAPQYALYGSKIALQSLTSTDIGETISGQHALTTINVSDTYDEFIPAASMQAKPIISDLKIEVNSVNCVDKTHDTDASNEIKFPDFIWELLSCSYPPLKSVAKIPQKILKELERSTILDYVPQFLRFVGNQEAHVPEPSRHDPHYILQIQKPVPLNFKHLAEGKTLLINPNDECEFPSDWDTLENESLDSVLCILSACLSVTDPAFAAKYKSNINGLTWAALLCINPAFSPVCEWKKLNGKELCLLMINRPSLRKHCAWSKFGGLEWSVLLAENPEFVENCEANNGWVKFSNKDWQYLLDERPWMSKYRPQRPDSITAPSRTP